MTETNRRTIACVLAAFRRAGVHEHVLVEAEAILTAAAERIGRESVRVKLPMVPAEVELVGLDPEPRGRSHFELLEVGQRVRDYVRGVWQRW